MTPATDAAARAREVAALFYDKRDPLDQSYRDVAHNIRRGRLDDQDAVELVRFALAFADTEAASQPREGEVERLRDLYAIHEAWPVDKHPRNGAPSEEWEPYYAANRARKELLAAIPVLLLTQRPPEQAGAVDVLDNAWTPYGKRSLYNLTDLLGIADQKPTVVSVINRAYDEIVFLRALSPAPTPPDAGPGEIQGHKAYPCIAKLIGDCVHHNGGTAGRVAQGIADPEADIMRLLDECLCAEGVYATDLKALDDWLGKLSAEDFDTVTDGEDTEVGRLLESAPGIGDATAREWIDAAFEHCICTSEGAPPCDCDPDDASDPDQHDLSCDHTLAPSVALEAAARGMCDRVNGAGDYDDNIEQRRPGWLAQAHAGIDAYLAALTPKAPPQTPPDAGSGSDGAAEVERLREAGERLLLAMVTRALRGRDHVPSMRDEQDAASNLRAVLSSLATQPGDGGRS